jgi:hypothetical protein
VPPDEQYSEVRASEVRLATDEPDEPREQEARRPPEPSRIEVSDAELTIASADGYLKMHLWAKNVNKNGTTYDIADGVMRFQLENRDTLQLELSDARYATGDNSLHVQGELRGTIIEEQLQFTASSLSWDRRESKIHASEVWLRGPVVDVRGEDMVFDLVTGIISFNGPVSAAL